MHPMSILGTVRKDLARRGITPTEREWMDVVGGIHCTTELCFTDEAGFEHKLWFQGRAPSAWCIRRSHD